MAAKKTEAIRAFVALDLDPMSLRRVVRVADRLRMGSGAPSASWTSAGKMHVTLKFMEPLPARSGRAARAGAALARRGQAGPRAVRRSASRRSLPSEDARIVVVELDDPRRRRRQARREDRKARVQVRCTEGRPRVPAARDAGEAQAPVRRAPVATAGAHRRRRRVPRRERSRSTGAMPEPEGTTYVPLARFAFATVVA